MVIEAVVLVNGVVGLGVIESVPVGHLEEGWVGIIFPVGHTVSNHETLKVWLEDGVVIGELGVVVVDGQSCVGNIDSGIGFSSDVEIVGLELWELIEPVEDGN